MLSHAKKLEKADAAFALHPYQRLGRAAAVFRAYRPYYVQEVTIHFDDFLYSREDLDCVEETIINVRLHNITVRLWGSAPPLDHQTDRGESHRGRVSQGEQEGEGRGWRRRRQ